jgi:hypothetical protein
MNVILTVFNVLGGIATLIFFHDRFGHLFYSRKPEKSSSYSSFNIWDDPCHARQVKSVRLKHTRIEGSGLLAGIILGLSGTIFGFPGYLIFGLLGMIAIAFCWWREDRDDKGARAGAVNEILAITGFVFSSGLGSVVLGLILGGLLDVDEKSYPGSLASILTLITTSAGGLVFGYLMRDL